MPPTVAMAPIEQAEQGAREAPTEGVVQPGAVVTLPMEAAAPMADVPWSGTTITPHEKIAQIVSLPVWMEVATLVTVATPLVWMEVRH